MTDPLVNPEEGWAEVASPESPVVQLSPHFLEIAACPACRSRLAIDYEASTLICLNPACSLVYPIRDGIPILLIDQAVKP